ncbi:MAG: hypothetical protein FJX18_07035 [Alphaproteobacteria bacterium]|nr:hypothetical protein [Alphaproteobacteria bacterium]
MKRILLLIVGFISIAHAELFVGEVNKPLEFDVTTAGYYKVTLDAHLIIELSSAAIWEASLSTIADSVTLENPIIHSIGNITEETKSDIRKFEVGHHTISASLTTGGPEAYRITSTSKSTWKYTVRSAEEIDYRNSIGDLQKSVDQSGTDIAGVKNDIATLQGAMSDQNKGLTDQLDNLKKQVDQSSANNAQNTALILSAINGVSGQVTTVNNNVTGGNKTNQTLGIIGLSLGAAGLAAGVTIPLLMKNHPGDSTDVSSSLDSDKESINYVAPAKQD